MAASAASAAGVALLERAVSYTLGSLRLVRAETLVCPTPCRQWDLRTLLDHLADSLVTLIGAVQPAPEPVVAAGDNVISVVRGLAGHLVGIWAVTANPPTIGPDGSALDRGARAFDGALDGPLNRGVLSRAGVLTRGLVSGTGAIEVAVHGWDIARACAVANPIPAALADELLDLAVLLVTDAERPTLFAPPVPISNRAEMSDRLVAYLGRDPGQG